MGYKEKNNSQNGGWNTGNNPQSGWNSGNSSQNSWNPNNSQSGWNPGNSQQPGWNPDNSQQNWNNMNPNSQWNPNMGGGYPGGPGKKNRGGLTKEVIIALLIAVAAVVFVVILFVVSGKKSSSQKDNNSTKSSTQAAAEATTQAATEETQATTAATTQATVATTTAAQSQNTATAATDDTYIFSDSDSRKLTKEEALRLSTRDAKLAKNEIYARRHRRFNDKAIQENFNKKSWYSGTIAPSDFDEDVFNEYEKANVELLKKAEDGTLTASTSSGTSSTDDGYIISDSSIRELTDSDLSGLSKSKLRIARNEIYARHHRKFDSADLQIYFDKKSWYSGTIEPSDFDEKNELSQIEKKNIDLIKKYE